MANEWTLIYETESPIQCTVANATGIEKGTLLELTDPFTGAAMTTSGGKFCGVTASEKIASDGVTKVSIYRGGIFRVTASGSITVGAACFGQSSNKVYGGNTANNNGTNLLGNALETAADGETFLFDLRPLNVQP